VYTLTQVTLTQVYTNTGIY